MVEINIGDTFYTADDYKLGRWTLKEIVNRKTADGEVMEFIAEDITGRKQRVNPDNLLANIEEAKKIALANWEIIYSQVKVSITEFTDEQFDKLRDEYAQKAQEKKQ